jgi:hypothetical protein
MAEDKQTPQEEPQQDTFRGTFEQFAEHQRRAFEESCKAMDALLPDGFKEHSAAARDEFRKSLKVLVDATIDELEKMTKLDEKPDEDASSDDASTTGRTKVKVQVD